MEFKGFISINMLTIKTTDPEPELLRYSKFISIIENLSQNWICISKIFLVLSGWDLGWSDFDGLMFRAIWHFRDDVFKAYYTSLTIFDIILEFIRPVILGL